MRKSNVNSVAIQNSLSLEGEYLKSFQLLSNIRKLSSDLPNDFEFGGEVRKLINQ